jgi:hypothetical protein
MTLPRSIRLLPWLAMALAAALAQDGALTVPAGAFRVRLLAPLNTDFSRKGDMVAAQVLEPAEMQGGILVGEVQEVKAGGGPGKVSTIQFEIQTLHMGGKAAPMSAVLTEIRNSRGQSGTDEQGAALESGGGALSAVSSKITGVFSRGVEPARLTAKAANLYFAAGSEMVLQAQGRRGK